MARGKPATTKLRFKRGKSYTLAELRTATAVVKAQVVTTLERRDGDSFANFGECVDAMGEGLVLRRYEITLPGTTKPSHEMWVYLEEHGVVFPLGEEDATPIHCVQRHFWSTDEDDEEAVALAEQLNDVRF